MSALDKRRSAKRADNPIEARMRQRGDVERNDKDHESCLLTGCAFSADGASYCQD